LRPNDSAPTCKTQRQQEWAGSAERRIGRGGGGKPTGGKTGEKPFARIMGRSWVFIKKDGEWEKSPSSYQKRVLFNKPGRLGSREKTLTVS